LTFLGGISSISPRFDAFFSGEKQRSIHPQPFGVGNEKPKRSSIRISGEFLLSTCSQLLYSIFGEEPKD
jgi:hypothetical protein